MSIRHRFDSGLIATRDDLRRMATLAVTALGMAEKALDAPGPDDRLRMRDVNRSIDGLDIAIEHRCHELMALEGPLASDLRQLLSTMRIATDLAHIGDLAVSMTKRFSSVVLAGDIPQPAELRALARLTSAMLTTAMEAFESGALDSVERLVAERQQAGVLARTCTDAIQDEMGARPDAMRQLTQTLRSVCHFEQVADICVSIVDEAVFFHSGKILRHHPPTGRFDR